MPAASGHFRAGKSSRSQVGGNNLTMAEWSASYKGVDLPVTNFESNGFEEGIIGVFSLEWSLSGNWNAAQNPNASPPILFPTDSGVNMNLYVNTSDNTSYQMPAYRVFSGDAKTSAIGIVTFNATGHSQGTFTVPTSQN